jgi:hypothetical protein
MPVATLRPVLTRPLWQTCLARSLNYGKHAGIVTYMLVAVRYTHL